MQLDNNLTFNTVKRGENLNVDLKPYLMRRNWKVRRMVELYVQLVLSNG